VASVRDDLADLSTGIGNQLDQRISLIGAEVAVSLGDLRQEVSIPSSDAVLKNPHSPSPPPSPPPTTIVYCNYQHHLSRPSHISHPCPTPQSLLYYTPTPSLHHQSVVAPWICALQASQHHSLSLFATRLSAASMFTPQAQTNVSRAMAAAATVRLPVSEGARWGG